MVAITVILAAVIAAFVFGMAGNVGNTKSVAATASQTVDPVSGDYTTQVTYQGGKDMADVNDVTATVTDSGTTTPIPLVWTYADSTYVVGDAPFPVGSIGAATPAGTENRDHVVAIASFVDGSQQVILDTYV
jgi:FlaG/FlaF family flagellin (archaellin)